MDNMKRSHSVFRRNIQTAAACLLWGIGIAYFAVGLWRLVASPAYPFAHDLGLRWSEMQLLGMGVPPAEVYATADYPPWAYGWGIVLVPPFLSWTTARIYFAAGNCAAVALLVVWVLRSQKSRVMGMLVSAAFLSMTAMLYCLSNGQYSIIVAAALTAMLLCMQKKLQLLAGICASLAMIKPHLAVVFLLIPLLKRQWITLTSCAVTTVIISYVPAAMTGEGPLSFIAAMFDKSQGFAVQDQGLAAVLSSAGLPYRAAVPLAMLVVGCAAVTVLWRVRRAELMTMFAAASVFAVYWSYHKAYDDVLLVFLLAASAQVRVWQGSKWRLAALCLLIALQAYPFRLVDHNHLLSQSAWIMLRLVILAGIVTRQPERSEDVAS